MIDNQLTTKLIARLNSHKVYQSIQSKQDLQIFMQHHVFSVWDFMSLIKYMQNTVAPAKQPWLPSKDADIRRFINELVLEEECDEVGEGKFLSHFELYLQAMEEVGANTKCIREFINIVGQKGLEEAFNLGCIPPASRDFSKNTFAIINTNKPHLIASFLALGREHIVPTMFRGILAKIGINDKEAPIFHFYLNRHIGLDEDFHAPLSLKLLNKFCHNEEIEKQAIKAGEDAVEARIKFWDGVLDSIIKNKNLV